MSQGRTHDSDIQALVEMGQGSAGVWSRDDAVWALEQTRGDVGRAGTLLINITSNGGSVDAWRSRNAPPAPGGGSTMPPPPGRRYTVSYDENKTIRNIYGSIWNKGVINKYLRRQWSAWRKENR